jgi:hypothetical protein
MFRCFCFALRGSRLLFSQPHMEEDAFYDNRGINEADDFHLMPAVGTNGRVDFPDHLNQPPPGF